jgi:hypothetical protein
MNDSRRPLLVDLPIRTISTARNRRMLTHISRNSIQLQRERDRYIDKCLMYTALFPSSSECLSFHYHICNLLYVLGIMAAIGIEAGTLRNLIP